MLEERLAAELQRRKLAQEREQREVQRIVADSEELRDLRQKLQQANVNKQRTAQLQEVQWRREQDVVREALIEKQMLKQAEMELQRQAMVEEQKKIDRLKGKSVLQQQMLEQQLARAEAYAEFLKEKQQVDALVAQLIEEDRRAQEAAELKRQQALRDMEQSTYMKQRMQQEAIERARREEEALQQYQLEQERRERELAEARAKVVEAQNEIFERLEAEERARREEQEYIERLRTELYYEEFEASEKAKEQARMEKMQQTKEVLMQANEQQKQLKLRKRQEEERQEKEFKADMMRKFAEDDRIEQMNAQRRRMKELEHKRQADSLWETKIEMQRAREALEEEERERLVAEERRKQDIIARERERLLKEHAPPVAEYLPKGTLRTQQEKRYLRPY
jgi:hypothetical protein